MEPAADAAAPGPPCARRAWRVAIGAAIGLAATTGLARLLAGLVYGVGTFDISSLLAVATLMIVAIAACCIPAVRATRVDPAIALRTE